jgi:arylsulfatase A-like enzyme
VGKWHLGHLPEHMPEAQGFEVNIAGGERGSPPSYFSPYNLPNLPDGPVGEHLPVRLVDEALELVDGFGDERFLLYLSFYSVHTPLQAPESLVEKYQAKAATLPAGESFEPAEQVWPDGGARRVRIRQDHAVYAAMVESMDTQVGRLLDGLAERGLSDDTLVVFMGDNGGVSTAEGSPTSNRPLRNGKGWMYDGGIREPMIIKWPGVTAAGSSAADPVISTDFYPTLLEATGLPLRSDQHQDGLSLVPLLSASGSLSRDALFFHYPHYANQGGFPGGAIRSGRYKLIQRYEDGQTHLYDLEQDVGEQNDLAEAMPAEAAALRDRLYDWYEDVDAKFLRAKPDGPAPWQP